jgi:hypothetical protein
MFALLPLIVAEGVWDGAMKGAVRGAIIGAIAGGLFYAVMQLRKKDNDGKGK